jgi:hypothetical protein
LVQLLEAAARILVRLLEAAARILVVVEGSPNAVVGFCAREVVGERSAELVVVEGSPNAVVGFCAREVVGERSAEWFHNADWGRFVVSALRTIARERGSLVAWKTPRDSKERHISRKACSRCHSII